MAALTTQHVNHAGVTPSYASCAGGGDTFTPGDRVMLHVKNGSGGSLTVTVATPGSVDGDLAVTDLAVAVGAGAEKMIGPFPAQHFADPALSGAAAISYSGVTTLTIAVLELAG